METKALRIRNIIFAALIFIFGGIIGIGLKKLSFWGVISSAAVIFVLGIAMVILTAKLKETKLKKIFFILTGVSAAAIPVCVILHNLVYGLLILFFGKEFWGKGGDEPVFFILAVIVFPALFVIGMLGSIVLLISARLKKRLEC